MPVSAAAGFAAVAAGGALGACARYAVSLWLTSSSSRFPFATLAANLSGALLAGILVSLLLSRGLGSSSVYLLLVTGFLGSFTTLSAFSVETLRLLQNGHTLSAMLYVLVSLVGALSMVLLGNWIARGM